MSQFIITIQTDNAAFNPAIEQEILKILQSRINDIAINGCYNRKIFDSNRNTVGNQEVIP